MTDSSQEEQPTKKFPADKRLQAKIGTGVIDPALVVRCQQVIDSNDVDFAPLAHQYLDELETAIALSKNGKSGTQNDLQNIIAAMTAPVMQLKANASVFNYNLIGQLANIILGFLERISELDQNALSIISAHHKTLHAIVSNKMTGNGGVYGQKMQEELENACTRYFSKKG